MQDKYHKLLDAFFGTLAPQERWKPSEWVEKAPCKIPDNGINPEPGDYKIDRTPFWREVLDAAVDPLVEELNIIAPTQIGKTTSIINLLGFWIDMDPGAALVLLPDETAAKDYLTEKILPMVRQTPALSRHMTGRPWDEKTASLKLDTMPVFMAWAGSPMRAASRAVRYMLCSEAHKFPSFSGKEADPISLGLKRVSNWGHRAKVIIEGTPTIRETVAYRRYESCPDKRLFWVPCPHCGEYQTLVWPQLKWPDIKAEVPDRSARAEKIELDNLAYYECCRCQRAILDAHRPKMLSAGKWASQDQVVTMDGRVVGPRQASKRVGFHLNGLYSPWLTFSKLAAETIKSKGDAALAMDLANSRKAEPFEQQIQVPKATEFDGKVKAAQVAGFKPRFVPAWAGMLLLSIDVQHVGFWLLWRAWGYRRRTRLVQYEYVHGAGVNSWDELWERIYHTVFAGEDGRQWNPGLVVIDSGGGTARDAAESRTQEVYHFCERAPGWLIPIRGNPHPQVKTVQASPYTKDAQGRSVPLYTLASDRIKSELMRMVRIPDGQDGCWELHSEVGPDYIDQLTAEEEVVLDPKTGERGWKARKNNHLWDCECYQIAAAEIAGANLIPSPEQMAATRVQPQRIQSRVGGADWMPEKPTNWMNR